MNCLPLAEAAYEQMMQTKQCFGKELGRQGYHIIISFEKGECRPDMAFQIGTEFVERYLGERYECIYAVHDDKEHCHIHIIFNSINMTDGKKYHYNKGDWKHVMQPITNELCKKYGLNILSAEYSREKSNISRDEWNHDKSYSHYILNNAWYCLSVAEDEDHFIWLMEQLGYTVKVGVHLAVWIPGMKRYKRLDTLDKAFARENILASIQKAHDEDIRMEEITIDPRPYYHYGMYGYQETYYGYLVRMRKVEMDRFHYKMARFYKDCMLVEKMQQRYSFLVDNEIHSAEDIFAKKFAAQRGMEEISKRQKEIYRENSLAKKRCKCPDGISEYQRTCLQNEKELARLKERKRELGRELRIAQEILDEKGLSVFEVLLEEGWRYQDYSEVLDRPEPPEYPYHEKALVEADSRNKSYTIENTEAKSVGLEQEKIPEQDHYFIYDSNVSKEEKVIVSSNKLAREITDAQTQAEESGELPKYYSDFMKLSYTEKAKRLCKTGEDANNILYLLQEYSQSVGHKFSYFDELMQEAELIRKAFDERNVKGRAEEIVDRLASMGITARNFMDADSRKIAECFGLADGEVDKISKQFHEVTGLLGVRAEQQELLQKFMEVFNTVSERSESEKSLKMPKKSRGKSFTVR